MIMTVTLNPALDFLISLETLEQGAIQRFSQSAFAPGGKGVNVSLLLSSLGVENRALGVAAGFSGREICRLLDEEKQYLAPALIRFENALGGIVCVLAAPVRTLGWLCRGRAALLRGLLRTLSSAALLELVAAV